MHHIAELNIAQPRFALDDPRIAEFVDALDAVNALAEASPGFVWRFDGEAGDAIEARLPQDPDAIVNLSVWESVDALKTFAFKSDHKRFFARRAKWFVRTGEPTLVMWPVPVGHRPSLLEAAERLADLRRDGPSPRAFGWRALANEELVA